MERVAIYFFLSKWYTYPNFIFSVFIYFKRFSTDHLKYIKRKKRGKERMHNTRKILKRGYKGKRKKKLEIGMNLLKNTRKCILCKIFVNCRVL